MAIKFTPHQYQSYAIDTAIHTPAVGLFLDMGLGKTIITLTVLDFLMYQDFEIDKALVIAPLRVAHDTWSRESEKWQHTQHLKISKILGSAKQRREALQAEADIYIINRENVCWLVDTLGRKWDFDTVVIDELSSFKSASSKRFKALRRVRPLIKRIIGLTGTPAPNSLIDLWPQIYLLDQGKRLGKTISGYRERYFYAGAKSGHVVYEWKQKKESEENIYQEISDICVSMKAEDWLEMPQRIDRTVPVSLDISAQAKYKKLERDLILSLEDTEIVANTAAVLSNKLLQMANGAAYDEDGEVQEIHQAKLDALEELIDVSNGQPVLVFYAYQHDLARIKKRIKGAKRLESNDDITDWNNGQIPVLLAHPQSVGHGLNLQSGGSIIVWFGLTWSLEYYQQANARLHRQGQQNSVIIHHLVTKGTIDEDVMSALENKALGQDALLEAVKARIEKVKEG